MAIAPGRKENSSLETNISLASSQGNLVQIDPNLTGLTAEALRTSVLGMTVLHECLQLQPWSLRFKVGSGISGSFGGSAVVIGRW